MKKSDCDKIIVDKNYKMTKIIHWFLANKGWLLKEEFRAPMESGLIVMEEEGIDIGFESLDNGEVKIFVYPAHIEEAAMTFNYDPVTTLCSNHQFAAKMRGQREKLLKIVFEADHTDVKESIKYHALMALAAHYEELVEVDEKQEVRRTRHEAKKMRKNKKQLLRLVRKTYVVSEFDADILHRYGEKRTYTKPDHEVRVRGFFRTGKNGKKTWIKPFSRYSDNGNKKIKEYKL